MVLHLAERGLSAYSATPVYEEEELKSLDWEAVYQESVDQTVSLLCFDSVAVYKNYVPQAIYAKWKNTAIAQMQTALRLSQVQAELCALLKEYKYAYVILKGTSAAEYYPNPNLRILGDIDFYIEKDKCAEIEKLLEENGYVNQRESHVYHVNFKKDNVTVEMHFDLPGMPDGTLGQRTRAFCEPIFETCVVRENELFTAKTPNDLYHGVIILLHALSHQTGYGVGLRHLCDWAAYVQKTQKEGYWQEALLPLFKEIGVYRYACALTKMCAVYLGIGCPDWAQEAPLKLCERLLIDMFTAGNFGKKDKAYSKSAQLIENKDGKRRGPFATLMHSLHVSIVWRYPIVKKVWIIYPFIFVWKVIKNLFLMCIGKRAPLSKTLPEAKKRKQIYEQLKIFEPQGEEKQKNGNEN